jgi:hypothetical protein
VHIVPWFPFLINLWSYSFCFQFKPSAGENDLLGTMYSSTVSSLLKRDSTVLFFPLHHVALLSFSLFSWICALSAMIFIQGSFWWLLDSWICSYYSDRVRLQHAFTFTSPLDLINWGCQSRLFFTTTKWIGGICCHQWAKSMRHQRFRFLLIFPRLVSSLPAVSWCAGEYSRSI